jgi:hypothetical protein
LHHLIVIEEEDEDNYYVSGNPAHPCIGGTGISPLWIMNKIVKNTQGSPTGGVSLSQMSKEVGVNERYFSFNCCVY